MCVCVWNVYDTFKSHGDPSVVQFKLVKDAPLAAHSVVSAAVGIMIPAHRKLCQGSGRIEDLNRCICAAANHVKHTRYMSIYNHPSNIKLFNTQKLSYRYQNYQIQDH